MQLVIANKCYSSWSLRAWLAARASGLPFDEIRIPLRQPDTRSRILEYSPSGRVPCLLDGEVAIWDSLAICEYLAEKCPALWPADPATRALARSVAAEMHSGFAALREHLPMNLKGFWPGHGRSPEVDADIRRIEAVWSDCRQRFASEGPWLFGRYSIADMMYAPVALRFERYGVSPAGLAGEYLATLLAQPDLRAWCEAGMQETETIADYAPK